MTSRTIGTALQLAAAVITIVVVGVVVGVVGALGALAVWLFIIGTVLQLPGDRS